MKKSKMVLLLIFTVILKGIIVAQSPGNMQFISPMPGSKHNTMESTIIIREGSFINK